MKKRASTFSLLTLLLSAGFAWPCLTFGAETNAPKAVPSSNRYLLIVETSRPMQKRADGALRAVEELLLSKMDGQLRRGDTLGVWTYNEDLNAGRFPLQQWSPEIHQKISGHILSYLKEQPYEKQPSLDNALAAMQRIVKGSACITVFIISDGAQPVQGTPFDAQINGMFKLWQKEQQKARMPFVTVLRGVKGKLTNYSVTSAPWPVELPDLPEPKVAAVHPPPPKEQKPAPPPVPPLIISGKKPAPAPVTTPPDAVTPAPPATTKPEGVAPNPSEPPTAAQIDTMTNARPTVITKAQLASLLNEQPISSPTPVDPIVAGRIEQPKTEPAVNPETLSSARPAPKTTEEPSAIPPTDASVNPGDQSPQPVQKPDAEIAGFSPTVAAAAPPFLSQKVVVISALVLAGIVLVLGLLTLFRPRPSPHTSLITRSLDRDGKL